MKLETAIERGIEKGFAKAAPGIIEAVLSATHRHPAYAVIVGGQLRLMNAGVEPHEAWEKSRECLVEFLKDEKIKFGHPDYAWDASAGATLVEEYEIEHWEATK